MNNDDRQLPDIIQVPGGVGSNPTTQLAYETTGRTNNVYRFVYRADLYSYPIANRDSGNSIKGGDYRTFYRNIDNAPPTCVNRNTYAPGDAAEGNLNSFTWKKIICSKILVLQNIKNEFLYSSPYSNYNILC